MNILGIETSCDETAVAVLFSSSTSASPRMKSSVIHSQALMHAKTGGVVPEVAARAHIEKILPTIKSALSQARVSPAEIDVIAVTCGPGLQTSLLVGVDTAKGLALGWQKPIIGINHMEAHAYSPLIKLSSTVANAKKLFPALSLVVSGGHTELKLIQDWHKHRKIGQTLDDAAGECFDKTAKLLGLPYPGGPALSRLAEKGQPIINFPRPMIKSGNFDFSFSGLKTAVLYYLRDHRSKIKDKGFRANVAASVQQAIVDVLVTKTIEAAKKYKVRTLLMGGGVAANRLLRGSLGTAAESLSLPCLIADQEFCTDNAAMIAYAGLLHASKKDFTPLARIKANSSWEL